MLDRVKTAMGARFMRPNYCIVTQKIALDLEVADDDAADSCYSVSKILNMHVTATGLRDVSFMAGDWSILGWTVLYPSEQERRQ